VGGVYGTHGRGKYARFWWESPKERDHSEDRGIGGRMGSQWILGRWLRGCGVNSIAKDSVRWQAIVNVVMNFRVLAPQS
jgi:hypothetical protein